MRTIVDLPEDQIQALRALGEQQHLSRAELVRRAVSSYLSKKRPSNEQAFGIWQSRQEDGVSYQERIRAEWDQ